MQEELLVYNLRFSLTLILECSRAMSLSSSLNLEKVKIMSSKCWKWHQLKTEQLLQLLYGHQNSSNYKLHTKSKRILTWFLTKIAQNRQLLVETVSFEFVD